MGKLLPGGGKTTGDATDTQQLQQHVEVNNNGPAGDQCRPRRCTMDSRRSYDDDMHERKLQEESVSALPISMSSLTAFSHFFRAPVFCRLPFVSQNDMPSANSVCSEQNSH